MLQGARGVDYAQARGLMCRPRPRCNAPAWEYENDMWGTGRAHLPSKGISIRSTKLVTGRIRVKLVANVATAATESIAINGTTVPIIEKLSGALRYIPGLHPAGAKDGLEVPKFTTASSTTSFGAANRSPPLGHGLLLFGHNVGSKDSTWMQ
ncbi:hypothetical protein Micbo1qcDRAFT_172438 [Microdochium bolleyi]|uniref:Uncharacterized protein n=1 Tax=Microdochium bolleyi TaxID=196109 RepID=A0A136JG97_9PEZI|nr:hypothetical protein Micbo1qcDRAFT_172438 [Microdochium bolleyi]